MSEGAKRRLINEKKFRSWEDTPLGRKYFLVVDGRHGWKARYVKEVDHKENTRQFYQEIYDEKGELVEVHKKYPIDEGHKKVGG